jgi:hypothetical protein
MAAGPTLEVSQPVQLTGDSHYERGQSVAYDGSDYWLFYGRSDTVTWPFHDAPAHPSDPDTHDYRVYYQKASSVAGLAGAAATLVLGANNINGYMGETAAAVFGGKVWAFASIDMGANASLYGWYTTDGSSWTEVGPIVTGLSDGAAHFDAVAFGGELWIAYNGGTNWKTTHSATPEAGGWSAPLDVSDPGSDGTGKFYVGGSDLYLALAQNSWLSINQYSGGAWSLLDSAAVNTGVMHAYDAALLKVGTDYVFAYAPLESDWDPQWVQARVGTNLATLLSTGQDVMIDDARYGGNTWYAFWPTGFTAADSTKYLFFTSERNPANKSQEKDGDIWLLPVTWDVNNNHYSYIQNAIDNAPGTTINVAAGTYNENMNIVSKSGLSIVGADKTTVIIKPSTTLCWNVSTYGCARKAAVRVVSSTDIVLSDMTFDFDLIKGNNITGVLYWDSSGALDNNILKNMSAPDASGFYYEITSYVRAPSSSKTIAFTDNTFAETGRLGIVTHTNVIATITGNTFYKTTDDFGYAMEIGSQSGGTVSGNTIYGYDTPAASDGSNSAGIYIENAFTGGSTASKSVTVSGNEVYGSQWGIYIGNEFNGYAGNVDILATLVNNNLHDNTDGGVVITDEDKQNGSSVTVNGYHNTLKNNGGYGYFIYTQGDGDITVELTCDLIEGHGEGIHLEDTAGASSTSSYNLSFNQSNIVKNSTYGMNNTVPNLTTIDAENNWWWSASGPGGEGSGSGDKVSKGVDFTPWLTAASTCAPTPPPPPAPIPSMPGWAAIAAFIALSLLAISTLRRREEEVPA